MIPSLVASEVEEALLDFLSTQFQPSNRELSHVIDGFLGDRVNTPKEERTSSRGRIFLSPCRFDASRRVANPSLGFRSASLRIATNELPSNGSQDENPQSLRPALDQARQSASFIRSSNGVDTGRVRPASRRF